MPTAESLHEQHALDQNLRRFEAIKAKLAAKGEDVSGLSYFSRPGDPLVDLDALERRGS